MSQRIDLTGNVLGAWTVKKFAGANKLGQTEWTCECVCGTIRNVNAQALRNGTTKSCGCLKVQLTSRARGKDGIPAYKNSSEYRSWDAMHRRCSAGNVKLRSSYFERGIAVCDAWKEFEPFLAAMGKIPHKGWTLDRIDNDKGYFPENCRWADCKVQSANRRPFSSWRKKHKVNPENIVEELTALSEAMMKRKLIRRIMLIARDELARLKKENASLRARLDAANAVLDTPEVESFLNGAAH